MQKNLIRNIGALTQAEQCLLQSKKIFICGCGGLGGFTAEFSARLGINNIVVCDNDIFDETNLNRQILCTTDTIKKNKAEIAKERILSINPNIKVTAVKEKINEKNAEKLIKGNDLVIDALDNIETRFIIEKACTEIGIPFVYGAVNRWCGQVSTIYPNDNSLSKIYKAMKEEENPSVLAFAAATVSSFQMAEAVRVLLGKPLLRHKILTIDLDDNSINIFNL